MVGGGTARYLGITLLKRGAERVVEGAKSAKSGFNGRKS